ncbi:MAG: retroviral-like aspartic protease family protein [Caldivirga sp.]
MEPSEPVNKVEVELIADTGATYTVISTSTLNKLGINPTRTVKLRLADNRVIEKPMGEVGIEIEGYRASATPAIFGDGGINLLGSVILEQLGLAPDPVLKRLRPTEALLMFLSNSS